MATIDSFTGTWDLATRTITLNWTISGINGVPTIVVGEFASTLTAVGPADRTFSKVILPSVPLGVFRFHLKVTDADGEVDAKCNVNTRAPRAQPVAPVVVVDDSLEQPAFENTDFDWLTYETVLNKPKFRKTNQSRQVGLYAADMSELQLWIRSDFMEKPAFNALCESFFPDHTPDEIRRLSDASWWWKQPAQAAEFSAMKGMTAPYFRDGPTPAPALDIPGWLPDSRRERQGSRDVLKLYLPRYAVLPYNFWDNDSGSRSLGTLGSGSLHPIPMLQLKHLPDDASSWSMWRSASRSCVMRVSRVKERYAQWPRNNWQNWEFSAATIQRDNFKNKNPNPNHAPYKNAAFKAEVKNGAIFRVGALTDYCFSVKTGVAFVGFDRQDEKQIIGQGGEWLCGSMRSDTIRAMAQLATARRGARQDDIVVQTEIMMLMERQMSPAMALERFGAGGQSPGVDGVALRDLTVLESDKRYIPPLSIPFIAKDMKTLSTEFAFIDDEQWCSFWQRNWAHALGRAKALFLVQYGMQHANPNVQNYLLEFTGSPQTAFADHENRARNAPLEPQVRVVIRDVADALLVREVAWALFGPAGACPQDPGSGLSQTNANALASMALPVLRYNFRNREQALANETGSTDSQFGPPGVQFLWTRFSGFYVGNKTTKNHECPPDKLPKALRLTSRWGIAHSAAYVRTLELALGVEFGAIRWDQIYDEQHHPDRFWRDDMVQPPSVAEWEVFANADMAWEEDAAGVVREYLRGPGRQALCDYHNGGWADATPRFSLRLVDDAGLPLALTVVYCSEPGSGKILSTRMTDPRGDIPFFSQRYADYDFWIASGPLRAHQPADGDPRMVGDRRGLELLSEQGTVFVVKPAANATSAGSVVITDPGREASGSAFRLQAVPQAPAGATIQSVRFLLGEDEVGTVDHAPWEVSLDTTRLQNTAQRKEGAYRLSAEATDSTGTVMTSATIRLEVNNPLPIISISEPAEGPVAGVVDLVAQASPGAGMSLASVQFSIQGGKPLGGPILPGASAPRFSTTFDAAELKHGTHKLVAIAKDQAGNTMSSAVVSVQVTSEAPTVRVSEPAAGPVNGVFVLTAEAQPGVGMTLENVQFKFAGIDRGAALAVAPYTMSVDANQLKNGRISITAVAKDTVGNTTTSAPVVVEVNNPPPTVSVTQPVAGNTGIYVAFAATAQAGAGRTLKHVRFILDDDDSGVNLPGGGLARTAPYVLDETQLYPGDHSILARTEDSAGNVVTSAVVNFQVV